MGRDGPRSAAQRCWEQVNGGLLRGPLAAMVCNTTCHIPAVQIAGSLSSVWHLGTSFKSFPMLLVGDSTQNLTAYLIRHSAP